MTKSRLLLLFCLSFVAGIFLSSIVVVSQLIILGFLILGIFLISLFWKYEKSLIVGFSIIFLVLGIWRFQLADFKAQNNDLRKYVNQEQKVVLLGIVSFQPKTGINSSQITLKTEQLTFNDQRITVSGLVLVNTGRYPEYSYGDKIKVKGFLKTPSEDISGFNYKNYLKKEGIL